MSIPITKFGELEKEIKEIEEEAVPLPFIVANFLGKDGGSVTGEIDMTGQPIKNLPDPTDGGDAVNKNYVDTSQGHSFFRRSPGKGYVASKDLNMNEQRLLNLAMPIDNLEAANKLYTDITANDVKNSLEGQNPFVLNGDKHKARNNIDMINFKIHGLPMPIEDKDVANKVYVDTLTEDRRRKLEVNNPFNFDNGEYGAKNKINMKGLKIEGVGFPDLPDDAATVAYVDEANVWERKNGGFVAKEHLYLGKKKLGGLKDPTANGEAANKGYVDKELKKVADETLKKGDDGFYSADTNLNLNNFRLFGVPDPTREDEAANRKYVDEKTANLQPAAAGVDPAELDKIKTDLEKNQAFNTRNQKTFNARGNINMKQKTIRNIPDPVEVTDVVNRGYVDEMKEFFENRIKEVEDKAKEAKEAADRAARAQPGGGAGNGNGADFGDMKGRKLINVGDPENPGDGVNRKYVDQKTPFTKTNGYYTTTHGINMDLKKITNLNTPTADGDASNKKYVDDSINNIETGLLRRNGGFLALDAIDMNSNKIKNVGAPQVYDDAVNKIYVDDKFKQVEEKAETNHAGLEELRAFHVTESTKNKNMRGFKIVNVGQPTDEQDATNKNYVDNQLKQVEEQAETNSEEIEKLKVEDGKRKVETDRIRLFINEIEEKREELKNYLSNDYNDKILKISTEGRQSDLIMNNNRIKNLGYPLEKEDAVTKEYADNNLLSKERIFRFMGTSIILIRGEAKGPIIGTKEVLNYPITAHTDLGRIALKDNEPLHPTIVYFGKHESAIYSDEAIVNGVLKEVKTKISPNYLIPFKGNIFNISFTFTTLENNFRGIYLNAVLRYNSAGEVDTLDLLTGLFDKSESKEYEIGYNFRPNLFGSRSYKKCFNIRKEDLLKFDECTTIYLYFKESMKYIDSVFITLAAQIHFPDYNEEYLPEGFPI